MFQRLLKINLIQTYLNELLSDKMFLHLLNNNNKKQAIFVSDPVKCARCKVLTPQKDQVGFKVLPGQA